MCVTAEKSTNPARQNIPPGGRRRKLWELEDRFHCSVVGTCLSLEELRKLARKLKVSRRIISNDYQLHRAFVGFIGDYSPKAWCIFWPNVNTDSDSS